MTKIPNTAVVMVSIGNRKHLSDFTYPRLSSWAIKHGYKPFLVERAYLSESARAPHFTKLMVHKMIEGFDRYIIIDDDIILKEGAPEMQEVPLGHVGMCMDAVQSNTNASHVTWTANSGFIVCDTSALKLLELAFDKGIYEPDSESEQIWGPFDQAILNHVVFTHDKAFKLDWRWNYQCVIHYYSTKIGWNRWRSSRLRRLLYYAGLLMSIPAEPYITFKKAYGLHMTMGVYPKFFSRLHK